MKAGLICIAACCSLWYFIGQDKPKLLAAIDTRIVDSMFRLRGSQETSGAVVIVDIDEKSLKEHGQWPWPRDLLADLTSRIYAVPTPLPVGLPGVEVHATIIDNLLNNDALVWASKAEIGLTYTLLIGGGLLMLLVLVFLSPISGFALALVVPLTIIVADYSLFFLSGRLVGPTFLIASLLTLLTTVTLTNYLVEAKRKSFIRRTFSRYVAPSVVNQFLKTPEKFHLAAETREVTVLFCYIRNFTSLAEKTPPAELSTLLNDYFSLLTGIITAHHGMVDKYIGDAIMAVWGTPLDDPRHPENAIRAALAIDTTVSAQSDRLRLAGSLSRSPALSPPLSRKLSTFMNGRCPPTRTGNSPPPKSSLQPSLLTAGKNCTASISKDAGIFWKSHQWRTGLGAPPLTPAGWPHPADQGPSID